MSAEPLSSRMHCVVCAEALATGALKCTKCNAFQNVRECRSCGMPTPRHLRRCSFCDAVEGGKPCRMCGAMLVPRTIRCNGCNAFQNWRRWLPATEVTLALILSLLSVASALVPPVYNTLTNRSETYIRVMGAENYQPDPNLEAQPAIVVLVANNGKRASLIKSAQLIFSQTKKNPVHATDANLEVLDFKDVLITPNTPVRLRFGGPMLERRDGKTKDQVLAEVVERRSAKLVVIVEETDWRGRPKDVPASHIFQTDKIYDWMNARVSSK